MEDLFRAIPSGEQIVRALLSEVGIASPPTRPESLAEYLKLEIKYFDDHKQYGLDTDVKAFLSTAHNLIGVHNKLIHSQKVFSILHEIGHFVLHSTDLSLFHNGRVTDTVKTLSSSESTPKGGVRKQEFEANQFAADCLFQLDNFDRFATVNDLTWLNIKIAAQKYDASIEATARRWVERSYEPHALIAFAPINRVNIGSRLKILYTIPSNSFKEKYFGRLDTDQELDESSLIYRFFYSLEYFGDTPETIMHVQESENSHLSFAMSLFSNSYRVFGLLTPLDPK